MTATISFIALCWNWIHSRSFSVCASVSVIGFPGPGARADARCVMSFRVSDSVELYRGVLDMTTCKRVILYTGFAKNGTRSVRHQEGSSMWSPPTVADPRILRVCGMLRHVGQFQSTQTSIATLIFFFAMCGQLRSSDDAICLNSKVCDNKIAIGLCN